MNLTRNISLLPFSLVLALFLGQNVLDVLHYPQSDPFSGAIFRLHPVTYFLFGWLVIRILDGSLSYRQFRGWVWFYGISVFLVFLFSITLGKSKANFFILDTLFDAFLLVLLVRDLPEHTKEKIFYWIKVFFVINCGLAIVERALSRLFFPPAVDVYFEAFRSFSLLGHPLNNSLITGCLTLYLMFQAAGTTRKFLYLGLGLMALFAFGGRTALAAVLLSVPFLLYFDLKKYPGAQAASKFFNYLLLLFIMLALSGYVLVATPFGERIFASSKFDDDSADVRSRVFDMFRHFDLNDLFFGIEERRILTVMYLEKVDIIENFWIIWIFKYGIFLAALLALSLLGFLIATFRSAGRASGLLFVLFFFLVASGNNSMATNTTAVSIITLAALTRFRAFAPRPRFERPRPVRMADPPNIFIHPQISSDRL